MLGLGLMPVLASVGVGAQNSSDNALARSVRQALGGDDDLFYRVVYAGLLVIGVKLLYDVSLAA